MLRVSEITVQYLDRPVGLGGRPWFGWKLESDRRNVIQEAYCLEIGADADCSRLVWKSGWVESHESVHVEAEGFAPESCTKYYVRVKVRDGQEESVFCEAAPFVMAILNQEEWQARFITAERPEDKDSSGSTCLRKEVRLSGEVESAFVCATALGLYHFYINGEKIGADEMTPGWTSYKNHLCYQTYEVTDYLKQGDNALGAMVGAGWYKGKMGFLHLRNNYGDRTAFLMQLLIRYRDGREEIVVTDDSWTGHDGPVTFSEIYDGETYDARLEIDGWNLAGMGQAVKSLAGQQEQTVESPTGQQEQTVKLPDGQQVQAVNTSDWRPVETVDFPMSALCAQAGSKVQVVETLPVKEILTTPQGDRVLDFGQNLTGRVQFRVRGNAGDQVRLHFFETLDAAGNVYTANLRTAKEEVTYICKGQGEELYHPYFSFQGFRYAHVISWPGELRQEDIEAQALHSFMKETGDFQCSHPLVNQLHHNIRWSMKGNFLDVPTDCPQRDERMGWTGDAQIFCRTACYLMNTYTFFAKWLKDVAADQTPEGGVPHVVPDIISGKEEDDWLLSQGTHSAAAWADVAVINPWNLYLMYGDKTILEEQYDSMKRWIGFMRDHAVDYIWNYKLQFGDWVALDAEEGSYFGATPNDLTCTAYFAHSTDLFARIAGILGRDDDAREYGELYEKIKEKFRRTFFQEDGKMTAMTQTAHIVALYFGLVPEERRRQTAAQLVKLLEKEQGHLVTGFVGTPYFCHALSRNGYVKEAYELLLKEDFPSWLYQVKMGATTIWEHWDGLKPDGTMWSPDMNSFNHYAYGAVGEWLYRVVLGIEADEKDPGYHHMIISPQTGDAFAFAKGHYDSVYGAVKVHWEKGQQEGERRLYITIPANTTADICLESGAVVVAADGLEFADKAGVLTAVAGSGVYEISYRKQTGGKR